ncbi:MAG: MFS transporter [Pseudomonadales bacterium]
MTTARFGNWYYGWNVLGTAMLFQAAVYGFTVYTFTFWVEPWVGEFGAARGEIMLAMFFAQVLSGAVAPFAGRAFDVLSMRHVIAAALLFFGLCQILVSFATAVWQIVALYALFTAVGLVAAGSMAGQILAVRWFASRRGLAMGWVATGTSIGGFALPPLVATLLVSFGWRTAHVIVGLSVLFIVLPIVYLLVRNAPSQTDLATQAAPAAADSNHPAWSTASILRSRDFWAVILVVVPLLTAFSAVQMNLAPIARDLGVGAQQAAFMMSLLSGTMIGGKLFFGAMADRWDLRPLFALSLICMASGLLLLNGSPSYSLLLLASVMFGLAVGGYLPLLGAVIGARFGSASFGRVRGLTWPFITLSAIGAPLAGMLRDLTGSYQGALWLFFATLGISVLAVAVLMRPSRAPVLAPIVAAKAVAAKPEAS